MILSIDPGLKGGGCVLDRAFNFVHAFHFSKKDILQINKTKMFKQDFLLEKISWNCDTILIEDQRGLPGDTSSTAFTIGSLYSSILLAIMHTFPHAKIYTISPVSWQNIIRKDSDVIFLGSKETAYHYARDILPRKQIFPKNHKKPHDGIIDAFCIGRAYQLNNKAFTKQLF